MVEVALAVVVGGRIESKVISKTVCHILVALSEECGQNHSHAGKG